MHMQGIGAVVTGGGSGLGEATARTLAAKGAKVAILDLGRSKGTAVAQELGQNALFVDTEVTNAEQVTAALDRAVATGRRAWGTVTGRSRERKGRHVRIGSCAHS